MTSISVMARPLALAAGLLAAAATAASAQQAVTVQSLLDEGYQVVGSFFNPNAGAVLFLQSGSKLFMCLATEGADSLTTAYCKPVG